MRFEIEDIYLMDNNTLQDAYRQCLEQLGKLEKPFAVHPTKRGAFRSEWTAKRNAIRSELRARGLA